MDINKKSTFVIVNGKNPDPAPKAWLGQKGHRTQRGAAPHVNEHSSIHHRSHNPISTTMPIPMVGFSLSNQRTMAPR